MGITTIEWTDRSWNPIAAYFKGNRGWMCSKPSPGCKNCYAEKINLRLGNGLRYTPENVAKVEWRLVNLTEPGRWRKPQRVFVESMGDLFHEALPDEMIWEVWYAMIYYHRHRFQVLTKRADRMRTLVERFKARDSRNADHIWLGVSVENQEQADRRIPELLKIPAAIRFLSCEPLLGPVDLHHVDDGYGNGLTFDALSSKLGIGYGINNEYARRIDWVIVGGESGSGSRPFHLDHARSIIAQTEAANVPVFVKQVGAKPVGSGEWNIRDRKGGNPDEWPDDLRIREFPGVK